MMQFVKNKCESHTWGLTGFTWRAADGFVKVQAIFTCSVCRGVKTRNQTVYNPSGMAITDEDVKAKRYRDSDAAARAVGL